MALLLIAVVPAFASYAESDNTRFQDGEFDFASLSRLEHLALACELDGKYYYFSEDNWDKIPADVKSRFTKKGVVVIGEGEKFILDLHESREEMTWDEAMSRYGKSLPTLSQGYAITANPEAIKAAIIAFGEDKESAWVYWTRTEYECDVSCAWNFFIDENLGLYGYNKADPLRVRAVSPIADGSPVEETELLPFDFASLSRLEHLALACELDGKYYYFSEDNWNNIPADVRSRFTKNGVIVIGEGEKFILDLYESKEEMTWDEAMSRYDNRLPTKNQAEVMVGDYKAINAAITAFGGYNGWMSTCWTSTDVDSSSAWGFGMYTGIVYIGIKTSAIRVRTVFTITDEAQPK